MNWIRVLQTIMLIIAGIMFLFSWEHRNFAFLFLALVIISALLASLIPKLMNIFLPIIATLSMIFVAEIVLPLISSSSSALTQYDQSSGYISDDYSSRIEGVGYRPNPGVYTSRKITSKGELIYDVVYTIGSDGYRNDIQSTDYTAYIYGGSFAFGEGLNDNETLSFYLFQNHGIISKNVGVHGYGLHQALFNIEQELIPQNVVNILLTAPWHALRSSCKPSWSYGTPKYEITLEGAKLVGACSGDSFIGKVLRKSNIWSLLISVFQDKNVITDDDIDLYISIIKEISRVSRENNSNLLIAYIDATKERLSNTSWSNESIISELSKIANVVDVTLSPTREELDAQYYIHELDMHPSSIANEQRAKLIFSYLKKLEITKN